VRDTSVYVTRTVCIVGWIFLAISALVTGWVTWTLSHWIHQATCGPNPPVRHRFDVVFWGLFLYLNLALPSFTLLLPASQRELGRFGPFLGIVAIAGAALSALVPIVEALWASFETMMC
jgi:hypothetical protein